MDALDHQQSALQEITARAKAYYRGDWQGLGLACRWPTLMVGPSGAGKSTVATLGAEACSAFPLRLSTPGYMPAGAHNRGTRETIGIIAEHVAKYPRTFLVIDELDKLVGSVGVGVSVGNGTGSYGFGGDPWQSYIRGELMEIMDGRWPTGLDLEGIDLSIQELTKKLQRTVFILGIGTFQSHYEYASKRTMGFVQSVEVESADAHVVNVDTVAVLLGRELGNRFHSELIRLPELNPQDYQRISRAAEMQLPAHMRDAFRSEIDKRIGEAITNRKSVRFLEEALTATLVKIGEPECDSQQEGP